MREDTDENAVETEFWSVQRGDSVHPVRIATICRRVSQYGEHSLRAWDRNCLCVSSRLCEVADFQGSAPGQEF